MITALHSDSLFPENWASFVAQLTECYLSLTYLVALWRGQYIYFCVPHLQLWCNVLRTQTLRYWTGVIFHSFHSKTFLYSFNLNLSNASTLSYTRCLSQKCTAVTGTPIVQTAMDHTCATLHLVLLEMTTAAFVIVNH